MIELTHITARYLKTLADGGPDYGGKWVLIRFEGERLGFTAFDSEEEAVAKLEEERHLGDAIVFQFPE